MRLTTPFILCVWRLRSSAQCADAFLPFWSRCGHATYQKAGQDPAMFSRMETFAQKCATSQSVGRTPVPFPGAAAARHTCVRPQDVLVAVSLCCTPPDRCMHRRLLTVVLSVALLSVALSRARSLSLPRARSLPIHLPVAAGGIGTGIPTGGRGGPDPSDPCYSATKTCEQCGGDQCGWCQDEVTGLASNAHTGYCSSNCVTTADECGRNVPFAPNLNGR
eukprot:SAG22_NODE_319_length_12493_cov_33.326475_7_plen_220_part_00